MKSSILNKGFLEEKVFNNSNAQSTGNPSQQGNGEGAVGIPNAIPDINTAIAAINDFNSQLEQFVTQFYGLQGQAFALAQHLDAQGQIVTDAINSKKDQALNAIASARNSAVAAVHSIQPNCGG